MTSNRHWWKWLPVVALAFSGSLAFATHDHSDCNCTCEGGATFLKLQYNGPDGTHVTVNDGGVIIFDAILDDGDVFSLYGSRENGRFVSSYLNLSAGGSNTTICVSCYQPLTVGMDFGPFTVVNMASRYGGLCLPEPVCPTGTNPVDLTVDVQGYGCHSSFRPENTAGDPAGFVLTARSSVYTHAPTNPDANGYSGKVVFGDDGAGVKSNWCSGGKAITGKDTHRDEELIVTFDEAVSASCVRIGLAGADLPYSGLTFQVIDSPEADAGADVAVAALARVSLSAAGSTTPPGTSPNYAWTQVAGPTVNLVNANSATPSFDAPEVSTATLLEFDVAVSDGTQTSTDNVIVAINPPVPGNSVPQADAGPNKLTLERTGVLLNASATVDTDGDTLTYQWVQIGGPPVILIDADTPRARFYAPESPIPFKYEFRVVVSDGQSISTSTTTVNSTTEVDEPVIFISSTSSSGYDYTIPTSEIAAAYVIAPPWGGVVPFSSFPSLPPGLQIDAFKIRETRGNLYVDMIDQTCLCTTAAECDDGNACNGAEVCDPECGCQPGTPLDCDDGNICNGEETCDPSGGCQPGTPLGCDDGNLCNGTETCDPTGGCGAGIPLTCDDGNPCNGVETCDAFFGCQSGTPVDCSSLNDACHVGVCNAMTGMCEAVATPGNACDDGNACTTGDVCNASGVCSGNTINCDDGLFCNGTESCDPSLGCQAGTPPNCDDGLACTVDACDEGTDACTHSPDDLACDDGLFCNGAESCDASLGCQAGTPPNCNDGVGCTVDSCDENADTCVHAPDDSSCNDGLFCNGVETCDSVNDCQAGAAPNCDDGVSCTLDSCDEANDTCSHVADDSICNDGQFCNGVETCDAVNDCQAGSAPNCDDSIACTADSCDESGDTCVHEPNDGLCDDTNPCTDDACVVGTGCVSTPDDGNNCSDGSFCNGAEVCQGGTCLAGSDPCEDGVACTVDSCDEGTDTCSNVPTNSLCDDSLYCNGAETCDAVNGCQSGTAVDCSGLNDQCTVGVCDESLDTCVSQPANENQTCDDDLFCTVGEVCVGGVCTNGAARDCSDGVSCTVDTCDENNNECDHNADNAVCDNGQFCDGVEICDPTLDCQDGPDPCVDGMKCHEGLDQCVECLGDAWCDDGLFCNGVETCDMGTGVCQPGTPPDCDDSVACTTDSCDETNDVCVHAPDSGSCSDGLYCNGIETCDAVNGCQAGTPVDCDDFISCTVDQCDEAKDLCINLPNNALCDDGLYCNGVETCDAFDDCQPGTAVDCSHLDDQCNVGTCDDGLDACVPTPTNEPQPCDDGEFCTTGEVCTGGTCGGGSATDCDDQVACTIDSCDNGTDACVHSPQNSLCDDNNPCTDDACDPVLGCTHTANDANSCDDGLYCNGAEVCQAGACVAGIDPCDDAIACTNDVCNEGTDSCSHTPDDSLCTDGLFCNGTETCNPATGCEAGAAPNCDDAVGCTLDSCDEANDVCVHAPDNGLCDDGDFCNGTETCDLLGDCQSGTAPNCDDGVSCTVDSCDESGDQCVHTATDSLCNDGQFCNGVETCDPINDCQSGTAPNCDDGVACTVDGCDETNDVCTNAPDDVLCTDNDVCNGIETCNVFSGCQAGSPLTCDDQNDCTDDSCDAVNGCQFVPDDTNTCSLDASLCTIDACVAGTCTNTGNVACPADTECSTFVCNALTGNCDETPTNEGQACTDDGNECTDDLCVTGDCTHPNVADNTACTDDANECTDDVCLAGQCEHAPVTDGTPCMSDLVDCTLDVCVSGECDNEAMDSFCDDALYCTGVETCDLTLDCVASGDPCAPSQLCCEADNSCVDECCSDAECDDSDLCTVDACVAGVCENDPIACTDDGLFCNGTEACDPGTGQCVSSGSPCSGGTSLCCEDSDACAADCCSASDCGDGDLCTTDLCQNGTCNNPPVMCPDDGLTCNGTESCDPSTGQCVSSGFTCPGNQVCCELTDTCEDQCDAIPTVSAWGMIALSLLLLAGAKVYFGRNSRGLGLSARSSH